MYLNSVGVRTIAMDRETDAWVDSRNPKNINVLLQSIDRSSELKSAKKSSPGVKWKKRLLNVKGFISLRGILPLSARMILIHEEIEINSAGIEHQQTMENQKLNVWLLLCRVLSTNKKYAA